MKIRQFGVIVHQRLVHLQHLERLPEEVRFEENRPCIDTRFSEHGEETVVFLLVETDGVPEEEKRGNRACGMFPLRCRKLKEEKQGG